MKLVKQKAEIHNQKYGDNLILDCLKHIEYCARICYKSNEKVIDGDTLENSSCTKFVNRLIKNGHMAMLEHGTMYLYIHYKNLRMDTITQNIFNNFVDNKYSEVQVNSGDIFITTNYRVLIEMDFFNYLKNNKEEYSNFVEIEFVKPNSYFAQRSTLFNICDRAIANELVRHRVFSFAQESTRYCNYNNTKFENSCTFIDPSIYANIGNDPKDPLSTCIYNRTIRSFKESEESYFDLIALGCKAQQARDVLSLGLKTEFAMTGFNSDWTKTEEYYNTELLINDEIFKLHFISGVQGLRLDKAAHPKVRALLKDVLPLIGDI